MIGLKELVLGASLFGFGSGAFSQEDFRTSYNLDSMKFEKFEGGIHDEILNKFEDLSYCSNFQELYNFFDNLEFQENFSSSSGAELSALGMCLNIYRSNLKIDSLKMMDLSDVTIPDAPLKKTIMSLDYVDSLNLSEYERCKRMYQVILCRINFGMNYEFSTHIEKVLGGHNSVCRDIVSVMYPLFNEYGIKTGILIGKSSDGEFHSWLRVNVDSEEFDLDPTWYRGFFLPLEKRSGKVYYDSDILREDLLNSLDERFSEIISEKEED